MTESKQREILMQRIDALLKINYQDLEERYAQSDDQSDGDGLPWDWCNNFYMPFGIEMLDSVLGGIKNRHLTLLVGEADSGTTSLALNVIANAAMQAQSGRSSGSIALFSAQHHETELSMRLLSITSGVSMALMRKGMLDADHWRALADAVTALRAHDIRILHEQNLKMDQVVAASRGEDHDLIVLDRFDLMTSSESEYLRETALVEACKSLRKLANDRSVPLLLTATVPLQEGGRSAELLHHWSTDIYDHVDTIIAFSRRDDGVSLRIIKHDIWPGSPITVDFDCACMRFS